MANRGEVGRRALFRASFLDADFGVTAIFLVTVPVRSAVGQRLVFWADHAVAILIINALPPRILPFIVMGRLQVVWASQANCRLCFLFTSIPQSESVVLFITVLKPAFFHRASFFFVGLGGSSSTSIGKSLPKGRLFRQPGTKARSEASGFCMCGLSSRAVCRLERVRGRRSAPFPPARPWAARRPGRRSGRGDFPENTRRRWR